MANPQMLGGYCRGPPLGSPQTMGEPLPKFLHQHKLSLTMQGANHAGYGPCSRTSEAHQGGPPRKTPRAGSDSPEGMLLLERVPPRSRGNSLLEQVPPRSRGGPSLERSRPARGRAPPRASPASLEGPLRPRPGPATITGAPHACAGPVLGHLTP
jgi:hypothetical protein